MDRDRTKTGVRDSALQPPPLRFRQFPAGDPRIHGFSPFGVGYVCSGPCLAAGLVTGFGMACFCPCLKMIRGGDAAEGSDILRLLIGT